MSSTFSDHFGGAEGYLRYRPRYPSELFEFLAGVVVDRYLAWDCATGSGQAAARLVPYFNRVVASDGSFGQLSRFKASGPRIAVALADQAPLADASVELVTVAQALHWFDLNAFYDEVRRVVRPGGAVAAWTYPLLSAGDDVDPIIYRFAYDTLGTWWPPEGRHVRNHYRELTFPFETIEAPPFVSTAEWSLDHLLGYAATWSSIARYRRQTGSDPVPDLERQLKPLWGPSRTVRWDLRLFLGRV